MKSLVSSLLRVDLVFSSMKVTRIREILLLVNLIAKSSIASIDNKNLVNKILIMKLPQNIYQEIF